MSAITTAGVLLAISLLFAVQAVAQGSNASRQTSGNVYIVAEAVSDASPFWFKYVLDLNPSADGVQARWIRIAPFGNGCSGVTVKAMSALIKETMSRLVQPGLCSLSPVAVNNALARAKRPGSIWDTVGFGIVAHCGDSTRQLHLPLLDLIDMDRLKRESREAAGLYDTYSTIVRSAFPDKGFYQISQEQDLELQEQGSKLLSELRSGKFDAGLSAGSFAAILEDYKGVHADSQVLSTTVQLVSPSRETFVEYTSPIYPPLARQARLWGDVELELALGDDGQVSNILSARGNPLLVNSARESAVKWRFPSGQGIPQLRVTLKYLLGQCERTG